MAAARTLADALAQAARSDHGYTFIDGRAELRRSYAEMQEGAYRVARSLREAGLGRGDLVAIVINDSEAFLCTLYGASMAGVVPASLYPPTATSDVERYLALTSGLLRSVRARAVVTTSALVAGFEALRASCPDVSLVLDHASLDAPPIAPDRLPSLDDVAFVQFTSGSTSAPKGVTLTHRNLCANIDAICGPAGLGTSSEDSAVSWLPLYHDMGLIGMAMVAVYTARPSVLMTPQTFVKRPVEWLKAISRHRATVSFAPNFAYDLAVRRVKDADLAGLDLSSWRVAGCGAEPIHAPTLSDFAARFAPTGFRATSFLPCYGLAEHVLAATFPPRGRLPRVERVASDTLTENGVAAVSNGEGRSVTLVSCGRALPDHAIRIVGEGGRELREREVGEITLAGPSVMLGYYKDDAMTSETIRDGWLHTGDLGYLSDGDLYVCGRIKDLIIIHGRKYHPQDLEWAVHDLDGIRRGGVIAFGASGEASEERVVMLVEPSGTVPVDALSELVRRRVSDMFGLYVDEVVPVAKGAIGRTTSGKVQRAATKARYERGVPGAGLCV